MPRKIAPAWLFFALASLAAVGVACFDDAFADWRGRRFPTPRSYAYDLGPDSGIHPDAPPPDTGEHPDAPAPDAPPADNGVHPDAAADDAAPDSGVSDSGVTDNGAHPDADPPDTSNFLGFLTDYNVESTNGQSRGVGTNATGALSDASVNARVRRIGSSMPLCASHEGIGSCGSGSAVEQPLTALGDTIYTQSDAGVGVVLVNGAAAGQPSFQIKEGTTTWNNEFGTSGTLKSFRTAANDAGVFPIYTGTTLHHGEGDQQWNAAYGTCGSSIGVVGEYATFLKGYKDAICTAVADGGTTGYGQAYCPPLLVSQIASASSLVPIDAGSTYDSGIPDGGPPNFAGYARTATCADQQAMAAATWPNEIKVFAGYHFAGGTGTAYATDGVHHNNTGSRLLAETSARLTEAEKWRSGGSVPSFLPASISISSSTITVDYAGRIPCSVIGDCAGGGPLAFDTTNVVQSHICGHTSNNCYGFEVLDPNPSPALISSVTLNAAKTQAKISLDKDGRTGTKVAYAWSAIDGALAGNGASAAASGSARGNLRSTGASLGPRSGATLHDWAVAFGWRTATGGASPPSSVASLIDDHRWTWGWVADSTLCPSAASTWVATFGSSGADLPYDSGTWSCDQTTHASIPSGAIGSARVNEALLSGSQCHRTAAGSTAFDVAAEDDLWVRVIGKFDRPAGSEYLVNFNGDSSTNNNWRVEMLSSGNLNTIMQTSGAVNLTSALASVIPVTGEWNIVDVYWNKHSANAANNGGAVDVCFGRSCTSGAVSSPFGSTGTGRFSILAAASNCSAKASVTVVAVLVAKGAAARRFSRKIHINDFNTLCPPGSQPCQ